MLNSFSVKSRLLALAVIPIAALVLATVMSLNIMGTLITGIDSLHDDRVIPLQQIKAVSDGYAVTVVDSLHKYRAEQMSENALLDTVDKAMANAKKAWQAYKSTKLTAREAKLVTDSERFMATADREIALFMTGVREGKVKDQAAAEFVPKLYGFMDPLSSSLEALIKLQLDESKIFREHADEQFITIRTTLITISVTVVIILAVGAFLIYKSINSPLRELRAVVSYIATQADLRKRPLVVGDDEIAHTARSVNEMLDSFSAILKEVNTATLTLGSAAEEMQTISNQVAGTADSQQQQTEMLATAVTEMSAAIQEVAGNAENTAGHAQESDVTARAGLEKILANIDSIERLNTVIDESTKVINRLSDQANEINSVVQMIQSVAEQTNLLALNAAIEAARAGDSGRGFAVVADEVRQLAHNTQKATEQISDMISRLQQASQTAVSSMQHAQQCAGTSVSHSQESLAAIEEISRSITTIADMNIQVSAATEEQTTVAADISQNINEFNDSIKTVTESSKQNAIASQELAHLAQELQARVARFKL
ncbi:methyl-accepting chemotaxis protein [Pseudoalteromonas fenneropenaei]|uniref:Methyl-accepting chemotaxis protein n=1 Tax=Pseudoalteromonas fenneropenaei TaxID=1737459 RepID=A0ABV7CJY4_9GAMM